MDEKIEQKSKEKEEREKGDLCRLKVGKQRKRRKWLDSQEKKKRKGSNLGFVLLYYSISPPAFDFFSR